MFDHCLIDLPKLERIDHPAGRRYVTPSGKAFPSVTTVLGKTADKSGIEDWKKSVGEEAAAFELRRAGNRGTAMHNLCEKLILNQEIDLRREMPVPIQLFTQLKPLLLKHVNNIRGIEIPLYSNFLRVAGTADLIAEWDGELAIIDYKTSNKNKHEDWITDYWLQCTIYAIAFEELTGIPVNKLVILMAVEQSVKPLVFQGTRKDWQNSALRRIKQYHIISQQSS